MSDTPPPPAGPPADPAIDPEAARRADAAKWRFFAIGLLRLSGAFILLFGMMISLHRFGWAQGDKARWLGLVVSLVGFFQFIFVPRLLARAWATPRSRP